MDPLEAFCSSHQPLLWALRLHYSLYPLLKMLRRSTHIFSDGTHGLCFKNLVSCLHRQHHNLKWPICNAQNRQKFLQQLTRGIQEKLWNWKSVLSWAAALIPTCPECKDIDLSVLSSYIKSPHLAKCQHVSSEVCVWGSQRSERSGIPAVSVWDVVRLCSSFCLCWACSFMLAITAAAFRARTASALRWGELSKNKESVHHPESRRPETHSTRGQECKCFWLCKLDFVWCIQKCKKCKHATQNAIYFC